MFRLYRSRPTRYTRVQLLNDFNPCSASTAQGICFSSQKTQQTTWKWVNKTKRVWIRLTKLTITSHEPTVAKETSRCCCARFSASEVSWRWRFSGHVLILNKLNLRESTMSSCSILINCLLNSGVVVSANSRRSELCKSCCGGQAAHVAVQFSV